MFIAGSSCVLFLKPRASGLKPVPAWLARILAIIALGIVDLRFPSFHLWPFSMISAGFDTGEAARLQ